ncbi:MAG: major capsid protein [Bacteroidetes bacterium]|nr:major capsid protein [Bacteroidota bacterium]
MLKKDRIVDPVLTELARGYTNAQMIATSLFPVVALDKEAGKVPSFGKEAFKIYSTERAIRAKSNRILPEDLSSIDVITEEHDLEYPVDYREENESMLGKEKHATRVVSEGIALRLEKKAADLAQTAGNYPSGNKKALTSTGCWSDTANSVPLVDIEAGKEAIRGKIGHYPNTVIMGPATFSALKVHPQVMDRIKYSMKGVLTVDLLKEIIGVDNVVVGNGIYASDAGVFADIWGDNFILAYVNNQANPTEYDPSFGYTYKKSGYPQVDKYAENGGKVAIVRSTDFFVPKIAGSDAGYLISNTVA